MDSTKLQFLKSHDISRMYVRFFDVVLDEQGNATPNATARFVTPLPKNMDIVPTVFLMPECLRGDRQQLAKQIVDRVMQMCETNDVTGVKEMQIDCDWTSSTRQAYHRFHGNNAEAVPRPRHQPVVYHPPAPARTDTSTCRPWRAHDV